MNPAIAMKGVLEGRFARRPDLDTPLVPGQPTILSATLDPEIRDSLSQVLAQFPFNTVWVKSAEDARSVLATVKVDAVFCEIWLQDGTCRDLIWHARRKAVDLSIIIMPPPHCPKEYRDWLASLNTKVLHFLVYPYRVSDLERLIKLAIRPDSHAVRQ